jgi:hypothetical protein
MSNPVVKKSLKYDTSMSVVFSQIDDIMKNNPNTNITYDMISEMIKNKPINQEKKLTKEELEKQDQLFRDFCDF